MRIREVVVGVRPHFELEMENGVLTTTVRRCPPFGSLGAGGVGGRCGALQSASPGPSGPTPFLCLGPVSPQTRLAS